MWCGYQLEGAVGAVLHGLTLLLELARPAHQPLTSHTMHILQRDKAEGEEEGRTRGGVRVRTMALAD